MYVHVLYVCACIFQYAFPPDMSVRFSWRKTHERVFSSSHAKSIFAGGPMYVCVCIACMCMYRLYMSVLYELILYWPLLQRQAQESPQRPQSTLRKLDFAHCPLLPRRRSLNRPPPHGLLENQARSELVNPVPSPIPGYWGSFVAPCDIQRLPQPPKDPSRPWLAHACMCLYMHVCVCISMYMYVYVCIVCMCVYLTTGDKYFKISRSIRATFGSVGDTDTCHSADGCSIPRTI